MTTLSLCEDCFTFNEIPELDGFYYHYPEAEAEAKIAEMEHAQKNLREEHEGCDIVYSGEENDEEFSTSSCECCESHLAGKRYEYAVIEMNRGKAP